jgi:integrase
MRGSIRKRGNGWTIVLFLGSEKNPETGKTKRRYKWHGGYRTRKEAERELPKLLAQLGRGTYVEPSRVTVGEHLAKWLADPRRGLRPSTLPGYEIAVHKHLIPRLGSVPLQKLAPRHLNELYAELLRSGRRDGKGGLSVSSVRSIHRVLSAALTSAVDDELLETNPASRAKPPRAKAVEAQARKARTFLTVVQLHTFLESVGKHRLRAAFHLAATTGLRRGELLGLAWSAVDLDERRLVVSQTLVAPRYKQMFDRPKSGKDRSIDLDAETVAVLRAHRKRQAEERLAFGPGYQDRHDLVFRNKGGGPIQPQLFTLAFQKAVKDAGLPKIRLHDLRHSHVALLAKAGVPAKVISERLGHHSAGFTLDAYGGTFPSQHREAAERFAALLGDNGSEAATSNASVTET